jgi:zinc transport system permease protein
MSELLQAILNEPFLWRALLAAVLVSLACGVTGTFVVVRGMGMLAGAIAHAALGGIGVAYAMGAPPMLGALLAALTTAVLVWATRRHAGQQQDVILSALWSTGMAVGVIALAATPGYGLDLGDYLFGSLLTVTSADLWLMACIDVLLVAVFAFCFREFAALSFDEEFAELRGLPTAWLELLLLMLLALTAVILTRVVGLVLVVALLSLPAALAQRYAEQLLPVMLLAIGLSLVSTTLGLSLSWTLDWPSGASVVLVAAALYAFGLLGSVLQLRLRQPR